MDWHHANGVVRLDRPRLLGIVNLTPDSFSDGGALRSLDDARRRVDQMVNEGADVIDIGGESTRPGAAPIGVDEELRRITPLLRSIADDHPETPVSVDTVKADVAKAALAAGASIVNDVSGFRLDREMASVCAQRGAGVVLMHSRGTVADMASYAHADYGDDVVGVVIAELQRSADLATAAGIAADRIVLDPGIGFSKRGDQSVKVLAALDRIAALGFPVMVGVSRKRFIGEITGVAAPAERVAGTIAANVAALERGARLFRVHDVRANREALDVAWTIRQSGA